MTTTRFRVPQMDCATEKEVIARRLEQLPVVTATEFDVLERVVTVHHGDGDAGADAVERALRDIEMAPERVPAAAAPGALRVADHRREYVVVGLAVALAAAAEIAALAIGREGHPAVIALAALALAAGAPRTFRKAWTAARTLTLNINLLMSTAVIGAAAIGQWPEAAVVVFLWRAARARRRGGRGGVERESGSGHGRVRAGGQAGRRQGLRGTINESGVLEFKTTGGKDQTTLAKIIRTVQEAQGSRAPTQRFVDNFARVYTPGRVRVAVLVAVVPWLAFGQPFYPWLYKALVLLVIACPCALVISTPVTVVSG
jgi:Cd2+/Zn2+-exporting ATPase